jgi:hypothetical protein
MVRWDARASADPAFRAEFEASARWVASAARCQIECLVRTLYLSQAEGLVLPDRESKPEPAIAETRTGRQPQTVGKFIDWAGFWVVGPRALEFRREVQGLFPEGQCAETFVATLRRVGVVPEGRNSADKYEWEPSWDGTKRFVLLRRAPAGGEGPSSVP